ncbi:hypothetical protein Anapl_13048 [Anas platyrhynchos]|uniref:Uncharacterized protein n=1 Tax=Anas platyrhynchos TaxID=8839 RepID=R0L1C2_ANAPL|nr:hypothetical protein Anapl_13048 [Anas platyrhynchos]
MLMVFASFDKHQSSPCDSIEYEEEMMENMVCVSPIRGQIGEDALFRLNVSPSKHLLVLVGTKRPCQTVGLAKPGAVPSCRPYGVVRHAKRSPAALVLTANRESEERQNHTKPKKLNTAFQGSCTTAEVKAIRQGEGRAQAPLESPVPLHADRETSRGPAPGLLAATLALNPPSSAPIAAEATVEPEDSSEAYLRFVFKALLQEDMVQTDGCFAMGVPLSFPPSEPFFQPLGAHESKILNKGAATGALLSPWN